MPYRFKRLYDLNLLTPGTLLRLGRAILSSGINLMALLKYTAGLRPDYVAIRDDREVITYAELFKQSQNLAIVLNKKYFIARGKKVAVICNNHTALVKAIFAISNTSADLFLLNAAMNPVQLAELINKINFDLIIHDAGIEIPANAPSVLSYHPTEDSINTLATIYPPTTERILRHNFGTIVTLTGGTTGDHKQVVRKPSLSNYFNPVYELLTKCSLHARRSVYIATPLYHGFGVAALLLSVFLGTEILITEHFDARKACNLIEQHQIEAISLVPLMLGRLLRHNDQQLTSLQCILSGGAALQPSLVAETHAKLGNKLFNLYGSSEGGFCILATPTDLLQAPSSIGRPITGVAVKITCGNRREAKAYSVGHLYVKSKWSAYGKHSKWVATGDLAYFDERRLYHLCGRVDDMIISGGQNVYPFELEKVLSEHHVIQHAAVIGINDEEFGQRLKAFVVPEPGTKLDSQEIKSWLSNRISRYQMPKVIEVVPFLPYTALGKPDKKALI